MNQPVVFDGFLPEPESYRRNALAREFRSFVFPHCTFHGISLAAMPNALVSGIAALFPAAVPTLAFYRRSPLGQAEPHFIHTDVDMGDWSALLYLNPDPPPGDGTSFWTHRNGATGSALAHERSAEGLSADGWQLRETVEAKFNRLVVFPSACFHSRALHENWGHGEDARLTQVVFGTGEIFT